MNRELTENLYDFSNYRLSVSQPGVRVFTVVIGLFNLALLIPDLVNLRDEALLAVCLLRLLYSIVCIALFVSLRSFRTFKAMSVAITTAELLYLAVFLTVFSLYDEPDFLIQLLGIVLIILVVFMVPNRFEFALGVSLLTAIAFFAMAYPQFSQPEPYRYFAAVVYIAAETLLCGVFSLIFLNYQRREYASNTELQKLYATDPLTQVGNRVRLAKEAEKWLAFCSRHNLPLSLVIIDIDNMKQVNDTHGHLAGDATICELVQTICLQLRKNDVCIRWGGDEFVLLLPGTNAYNAQYIVERIRSGVETHAFMVEERITCSFGIAQMYRGATLQDLMNSADQSLYTAKRGGKNTVRGAGIAVRQG